MATIHQKTVPAIQLPAIKLQYGGITIALPARILTSRQIRDKLPAAAKFQLEFNSKSGPRLVQLTRYKQA